MFRLVIAFSDRALVFLQLAIHERIPETPEVNKLVFGFLRARHTSEKMVTLLLLHILLLNVSQNETRLDIFIEGAMIRKNQKGGKQDRLSTHKKSPKIAVFKNSTEKN